MRWCHGISIGSVNSGHTTMFYSRPNTRLCLALRLSVECYMHNFRNLNNSAKNFEIVRQTPLVFLFYILYNNNVDNI